MILLKTSWRFLEDVFQDVLKTFWRGPQKILKMCCRRFSKTSWRRLENVLKIIGKTSWKRLEDVLKKYSQDEYNVLDQDNLKTSWRRLLKTKTKDVFKTSSSRQMFAGILFLLQLHLIIINSVISLYIGIVKQTFCSLVKNQMHKDIQKCFTPGVSGAFTTQSTFSV